jgi:hypothetical protein
MVEARAPAVTLSMQRGAEYGQELPARLPGAFSTSVYHDGTKITTVTKTFFRTYFVSCFTDFVCS